jgi:DNA-binding PadR family transcriptional regulator
MFMKTNQCRNKDRGRPFRLPSSNLVIQIREQTRDTESILHHAGRQSIFGAGMAEELARHGYKISPGTLYPILRGLEKHGYLESKEERCGRSARCLYRITAAG